MNTATVRSTATVRNWPHTQHIYGYCEQENQTRHIAILCIWESSSCFRGSSSVQYTAQKPRNSQPKECLTGTTFAPAGSEQWIKSAGKVCKMREVTRHVSAQGRQFICLIQSGCLLCIALTVVSLPLNMCGNCFYKNITLKKIETLSCI